MPASQQEKLNQIFLALAHPVRRSILEQCGQRRQSVAELAEPHAMSLNAVSKHIKTLEVADLITREQDGNFHRIGAATGPLKSAIDWLAHHVDLWDSSLLALKEHLESTP